MAYKIPEGSQIGVPKDVQAQDVQKAVSDAFVAGPNSVIQTNEKSDTKRFILKTQGYYDIQAYVCTGIQFPGTTEDFSKKISKEVFDILADIDPNIYTDTRNTIVDVSKSCNEFKKKTMGLLWSSPQFAIEYADEAISHLQTNNHSFQSYWKVLVDPKYEETASWDDAFYQALRRARIALKNIQSAAIRKGNDMQGLVNDLTNFLLDTKTNKGRVDSINERYNHRKVKKDGKEYKNYIAYLDSEVAAAEAEMLSHAERMRREKKVIDDSNLDALSWCWVPGYGLVNASMMHYRVKLATEAWGEARKKLIERGGKSMQTTHLVSIIRPMCFQFEDLVVRMGDAINAINEVALLFSTQASNYSTIVSAMDSMEKGVESKDFDIRQMNIEDGIVKAVEKLTEVKNLAQEFQNTSLIEIEDGLRI